MKPSSIAVLAGAFTVPGHAQQLLDRLLAGYARDGDFRPRVAERIVLHAPGAPAPEIERRRRDFALETRPTLAEAVMGAEAALVVWPGTGQAADVGLLEQVLRALPETGSCFVHGLIGRSLAEALPLLELAAQRRIRLTAATTLATTFRLPEHRAPAGEGLKDSLIVVQGATDDALLDGVEGLLPDLERVGGPLADSGPGPVERYAGEAVWAAWDQGRWPGDLLAAALSRSDNPQGDPVADGRTQDLVGLGLVPRLAREPRAWVTRHGDGSRSTILALDGVVADIDLALRTRRGRIHSAQLHRPPSPGQHAFDPLAGVIDDFLCGGRPPWGPNRARYAAAWYGALRAAA